MELLWSFLGGIGFILVLSIWANLSLRIDKSKEEKCQKSITDVISKIK